MPLGESHLFIRASLLQEIEIKSARDIVLHETQAQCSGQAHLPSNADGTEMGLGLFSGLSEFLWRICWTPCFCLSVKIGGCLGAHKSEVSPSKMPFCPCLLHSKVKLCMWMAKLDPRCELTWLQCGLSRDQKEEESTATWKYGCSYIALRSLMFSTRSFTDIV